MEIPESLKPKVLAKRHPDSSETLVLPYHDRVDGQLRSPLIVIAQPSGTDCKVCKRDISGWPGQRLHHRLTTPPKILKRVVNSLQVTAGEMTAVFCSPRCLLQWNSDINVENLAVRAEVIPFCESARGLCEVCLVHLEVAHLLHVEVAHLHRCAQCLCGQYCSEECRRKDRKVHRKICSLLKEDEVSRRFYADQGPRKRQEMKKKME